MHLNINNDMNVIQPIFSDKPPLRYDVKEWLSDRAFALSQNIKLFSVFFFSNMKGAVLGAALGGVMGSGIAIFTGGTGILAIPIGIVLGALAGVTNNTLNCISILEEEEKQIIKFEKVEYEIDSIENDVKLDNVG